jgi:hypothetical protein
LSRQRMASGSNKHDAVFLAVAQMRVCLSMVY